MDKEEEIIKEKKLRDKRVNILSGLGIGYLVFAIMFSIFGPFETPVVVEVLLPFSIGIAIGLIMSIISVKLNYETTIRLIELQSTVYEMKKGLESNNEN